MRVRIRRKRPDPWATRRQTIMRAWAKPFWAFEWFCEYAAFLLNNWSFLEVLEYLSSLGVIIAVVFYFAESGDRIKQKHYQAWQVINTAQGKGGSGGRIEALQELNKDGIPLVGVDVSGAFLQGIQLAHAHLVRSNLSAADLRDSDLAFADLSDSVLQNTNLRQSNLHNADLQRANLIEADLFGADLSGTDLSGATLNHVDLRNTNLADCKWREIVNLKDANVFGVKNAPEGFVAYALSHGAVQIESDSQ
jgi:Pentapeptide repeats (8 copies)